jgi:chromosomal replication initiator protein
LSQLLTRINRIKFYAISSLMKTIYQGGIMTDATKLNEPLKCVTRQSKRQPPRAPIIPRERIYPPVPDQTARLVPIAPPEPPEPKLLPLRIKPGIDIVKIPPRQSTRIIEETAAKHELSVEVLKGASRKTKHILARHEACYLLREAGYSYPQIGRFLGGRDHTTAMNGAVKHEQRMRAKGELT